MSKIKDYASLTKHYKNSENSFDVKIILAGCFSRKTVFCNGLGVFNYIDETEVEFKNSKQAEKYWKHYFDNHIVVFDGYN